MKNDEVTLHIALTELKRQMQTTDAEWPDITWRISQRFGVTYEQLADAYDADETQEK